MSVTCSICLASYDEDDDERDVVVIKCGHTFHRSCLLEWKNSSKNTTCPECRTKYTARTINKLYLNILPKCENVQHGDSELYGQLSSQQMHSANLQKDKERLDMEKQQMEYELLKSRNEYQNLIHTNKELKMQFDIKCQAYSLINVVNDEYLNTNENLRDENQQLKEQIANLKQELEKAKVHQLRVAKPFVDLTHDISDDDSDIEIVEDKNATAPPAPAPKQDEKKEINPTPTSEVIELDDEIPPVSSIMEAELKFPNFPSSSYQGENVMKNSIDESLSDLQSFENFLLEQM